jgi:hypothetical protein
MIPLECFADSGVSIKVFMPLLYDKFLVLDCKVFGLRKFTRLHADRLPQNDIALHDEDRFPFPRFTWTWIGVWSLL